MYLTTVLREVDLGYDQETGSGIMYKQILIISKLGTGERGKKT
jgi:hypothetical protein